MISKINQIKTKLKCVMKQMREEDREGGKIHTVYVRFAMHCACAEGVHGNWYKFFFVNPRSTKWAAPLIYCVVSMAGKTITYEHVGKNVHCKSDIYGMYNFMSIVESMKIKLGEIKQTTVRVVSTHLPFVKYYVSVFCCVHLPTLNKLKLPCE